MRRLLRVACIVTGLALAMGGAAIAETLAAGDDLAATIGRQDLPVEQVIRGEILECGPRRS